MRPRRLKLGTHIDSGQMYHVYRNQAAATYLSLYFFIFLSLQFSTLKFLVTLYSGAVRPRRLKLGTHMDSGQMYHVYRNQAAAAYSSLYFFSFLSLQFSTLKFFITLFSGPMRHRRLKIGTHVDSGQMYHVYQNQAAAYSYLNFFLFLSLQFSTFKVFIILFSGTVRPRRLKLGTHIDSGQMYHVYRNQAAATYLSLYFFIFLSLQFSTLEFLVTLYSGAVRPRRLNLGTHMDNGQMYHVYWNQAAAAYSSLFSSVLFLSNFQHWNFSSHFSRELWDLEDWKLVHTWTVGRCIMFTRIRLLLLIHPIISSVFFLSNFQHRNFWSHFSRELWGLEDWNLVHTWTAGRCIMYTRIRLMLLIHPFISSFFFLSNFQHWNFSSHFSRELWGLEDWKLVHPWTVGRCIMYTRFRLLLLFHPFIHFPFSQIFNIEIFRHTFLRNYEV